MLQHDFERSIGYWIVSTANALERALNEELVRHGITVRQWQVLAWLALEGELTQSELVERMRIEASTLVGILDRMERDGWVTRIGCPTDGRKKLVRPTERVEPIWAQTVACVRKVRARATRGIAPERIELVMDVLAAMQDNLATRSAVLEQV